MSHIKLIQTPSEYKIHKIDLSPVSWFKEILHDRTQKVVIDKTFSGSLPIFSGMAQGGVLAHSYL